MITQIKDLTVPPQPAQHLSSGLVGQRVSVSVSQHITHTHVDNLPQPREHIHCDRENAVLLVKENLVPGILVGCRPAHPTLPRLHWLEQECRHGEGAARLDRHCAHPHVLT